MGSTLSESPREHFFVPDADGHEIRLGSLWEQRRAVVVFLRHYG